MKLPKEPYGPKQVTAFKAARKLGADESQARLAGHKPDNPNPPMIPKDCQGGPDGAALRTGTDL
jgi:hypothetical protein